MNEFIYIFFTCTFSLYSVIRLKNDSIYTKLLGNADGKRLLGPAHLDKIRKLLRLDCFIQRHKTYSGAFTRCSFFSFEVTWLMLFQKTLKSIQQHIHSVSYQLKLFSDHCYDSVSPSAWTRARAKLSYSAFIELNEQVLVKDYYANDHLVYKGYRLLALDGW